MSISAILGNGSQRILDKLVVFDDDSDEQGKLRLARHWDARMLVEDATYELSNDFLSMSARGEYLQC